MHFEKFYVATMLTGALKGDESVKLPSDSILEGAIYQNFLRVLILTSPMHINNDDKIWLSLPFKSPDLSLLIIVTVCIPYMVLFS